LNDEPRFDLAVPGGVLAGLTASASLVVELTPRPLLEVVAEVLNQDDRLIAELRADLLKRAKIVNPTLPAFSANSSLHLASDLEQMASLLKKSLASRDQSIAQQAMQLERIREELMRAESQLDLLKDVMLGVHEEDRL
jgi:phage shock protein A